MRSSATRTKYYFPALTGLRAIAAWLVFFHHFNPFPEGSLLWRFVMQWYTGVAIFFVLSGFLICTRYYDRLNFSRQWLTTYVRNRVARIYPLYLLLTCLTFIVISYYPSYDPTHAWATYTWKDKSLAFGLNITLLRGLFERFIATGIRPAWTLTVEECFYLLAPLLLAGLSRRTGWRLVGYAVALFGLGAILVNLPAAFHRYGFFASWEYMLTVTFPGRCIEFLAGTYLGLLLLKRLQASTPNWPVITLAGIAWILTCWGIMTWVFIPESLPQTNTFLEIFLNNVVLVPGICLLLYGLVSEQSIISRVLGSKFFDLLGKASYAFYLIHYGVINQSIGENISHNILMRFILINLVAIGLYKLVEHPIHKLLTSTRKG